MMQHLLRGLQLAAAKLAASRVGHSFLALVATALVIIFADLWQRSWLALLLLWAGIAALLSPVWSVVVFGGGLLISWALSQASTYKVALNGMPITTLDIKITAANPAVLWYLLGLPQWSRLLIILLVLSGTAYVVYRTTRHIKLLSVLKLALWASAVAGILVLYEAKLAHDLGSHLNANKMWAPHEVAKLARKIGPIPFLLYSWRLERQSGSPLFDSKAVANAVSSGEVASSVERLLSPIGNYRPNIVLIQLESIFDPNRAFELDAPVRNFVFDRNEYTQYLLPMRVNVIGGGSWISEFEVLTGLDFRLFGYLGYYTHATVAPYIDGAFPAYLRRKGYRTNAFYTDGKFYNARNAYARYGFDDFWDHQELKLSDPWNVRDSEMAKAFVTRSQSFETGPFFSFIDTNGATRHILANISARRRSSGQGSSAQQARR